MARGYVSKKLGSPPQVRGKPLFTAATLSLKGITPAGAGKTYSQFLLFVSVKDHPRRCGENTSNTIPFPTTLGSPPQVRGKLYNSVDNIFRYRITPAGAGKTVSILHSERLHRDHPRRCGENPPPPRASCAIRGSPPQVRGKLARKIEGYARSRITPAGAGKTTEGAQHEHSNQDHPRRCGENHMIPLPVKVLLGSPPQVRGKHYRARRTRQRSGITPAGAGKTSRHTTPRCLARDHPRRCGENADLQGLVDGLTGSPPQVRGKRRVCRAGCHKHGITPAGAGKTRRRDRAEADERDHPRRCGENDRWNCISTANKGSPPQVRGKRIGAMSATVTNRITPAGAGKTIFLKSSVTSA